VKLTVDDPDGGGKMRVRPEGKEGTTQNYTLQQCHWHWGSQHTIGGRQYPLVAHCIHTKDGSPGQFGVLAILYEVGTSHNTSLAEIADHLPVHPDEHKSGDIAISMFTGPMVLQLLAKELGTIDKYWNYSGSLTTPPCTEAVDWYILMRTLNITQSQLDKMKRATGWASANGNFRPPQPLNGRFVEGCAISVASSAEGSIEGLS